MYRFSQMLNQTVANENHADRNNNYKGQFYNNLITYGSPNLFSYQYRYTQHEPPITLGKHSHYISVLSRGSRLNQI